MAGLTIGQVARQSEVNIETLRYYERRGLIPEPPRQASGYRQYDPQVVQRIQFIKRAQELGFTLKEISELLTLRVDPDTTCEDVRRRAEAKIADIEEKVRSLQRIKKALVKLTAACSGRGPTGECPILEALRTKKGGIRCQRLNSSTTSIART
jgi:MerR family mercuric resistance operon transcriptional regulator